MSLEKSDLKVGHTYRAKRFKEIFNTNNDRVIVYLGANGVQYDSDTVKMGRHYPCVDIEKFLRWAKEDVTHLYRKPKSASKP